MTSDRVRIRTIQLLLRSYPASNAFLLAHLAGCDEREAGRVLGRLEQEGMATASDGKWRLTACGRAACSPLAGVELRPLSPVKARMGRRR
jgi:hypothetical protein